MSKKNERPSTDSRVRKRVNTRLGLFLRKDADINSPHILVMPYNSIVEIIVENAGVSDGYEWVKCSYRDTVTKKKITGYAVSMYLS